LMATPGSARPPLAAGGWSRGYPWSMGRPCGHPRGLRLARTWGWPSGQPFCSGITHHWVCPGCDGVFRPGRCGPARALVAFSDLGGAGSLQTHVGGVGVGLVVAASSDPVGGSVVQYGRWRRGLAWTVPAESGLAVVVRIWAGVVSLFSTSLRGKWGKRSGVSTTL
jgi:hypothetical protein